MFKGEMHFLHDCLYCTLICQNWVQFIRR